MKKKILSIVLALAMVLSLMPMALAESNDEDSTETTTSTDTTLPDAVDGVITLTQDVTATLTVNQNDNITLDLNGHTLTNTDGQHTIVNNGTLTIKDSSENGTGTVDNVSHQKAAIYNSPGATCTILAGNFIRSKETGIDANTSGGNSYYVIKNFGTITVGSETGDNSRIKVEADGKYSSLFANGWQDGSTAGHQGKEPEVKNDGASLTIYGGTYSGGLNTIKNDDYGTLVIYDGTFTNIAQYAVMNYNVATIHGGTYTSESCAVWNYKADDTMDKGELTISGGTFTSEQTSAVLNAGKLTINDGTFIGNPGYYVISNSTSRSYEATINGGTYSSQYVSNGATYGEDLARVIQADGTCVVEEPGEDAIQTTTEGLYYASQEAFDANFVAKIGTMYYSTLAAAINAANDGDTVTLLNDTSISSCISISKSITLDLNGNTLTGPSNNFVLANSGDVTVEVKGGTINSYQGFYWTDGSLTLTDVSLTTTERAIGNYNNSTVTVGAGSTVSSTGYVAIVVWGDADNSKAPTLNVYGTVTATARGKAAISGNGTDYSGTTINIYDGAYVKSASTAIYHPQPGTLNVYGGTIEGYCGIGIKSGNLNISGGTIRGTADDDVLSDSNSTSNGIVTDGSAIVVDSNTAYAGQMNISISDDAVIESLYSTAIREIGSDEGETNVVSLTVAENSDVKIISAEGKDPIQMREATTENVTLSGGNYSDSVNPNYLDEKLTAELVKSSGNAPYSYYTSVEEALKDAQPGDTITNLNPDPDSGETGDPVTVITVTYQNGDESTVENVLVNTTVTLPSQDNNGYWTFLGWTVSENDTVYAAGETYTVSADTTFVAQWRDDSPIPAEGVTVSPEKLYLYIGDTRQLTAKVSPDSATDKTLTWKSSDTTVAKVDANGKVTAVGYGKATITVTTTNGSKTATCTVIVHYPYIPTKPSTPSTPTYAVNVSAVSHGAVTVSPETAAKGDTVTITVRPDEGYELDSLIVFDAVNKVPLTQVGDTKFTFTMPGSSVTVSAAFSAVKQEPAPWTNPYTDVAEGVWYYDAVQYVTEHGLMGGADREDTFQPAMTTTRGMIMTILARMNGVNTEGGSIWYEKGMNWAVAAGVSDGTNPGGSITRQELVTMLWRYVGEPASSQSLSGYPDASATASWAADAMRWAVENGIITQTGEGLLNPAGTASRAEVATILMRFCENIVNK